MELSKGKYRDALSISQNALQTFPKLQADKTLDYLAVKTLAEAQLGHLVQARLDADKLFDTARQRGDEYLIAQAELTAANVYLALHLPVKALSLARTSNAYFSTNGEKESEWISLLYLAQTEKELGDVRACADNARTASEILNQLKRSWGPSVFNQYVNRPDHRTAIRELIELQTI
jgi:tetratricopeptide (TPR) repeat protein